LAWSPLLAWRRDRGRHPLPASLTGDESSVTRRIADDL
jgi:hypothetical protein